MRPKSGRWKLCYYGGGSLSNTHKLDLTIAGETLAMKLSAQIQDRGWRGELPAAGQTFAKMATFGPPSSGALNETDEDLEVTFAKTGESFTATPALGSASYLGHVEDGAFTCPEKA